MKPPSVVRHPLRPGLIFLIGLLVATVVLAQGGQQGKKTPEKGKETQGEKGKQKSSQRIFGGKISLVSSQQETDTAGHGFKGVDEGGQVQKAVLTTQPGPDDYQKVAQLAALEVSPEELAAFLAEGGLRSRASARGGGGKR
jgi:hypothetical protein